MNKEIQKGVQSRKCENIMTSIKNSFVKNDFLPEPSKNLHYFCTILSSFL
jgi:hypothetical protein